MDTELNVKIDSLLEQISKRKHARIKDIDGVIKTLPTGRFVWQQATEYPEESIHPSGSISILFG